VHVVFTYDGEVARTFVDGMPDKMILLPGGTGTSDGPLQLGRCGKGRWNYGFTGPVDDVLIWNRALTEVEVLGLCAAMKGIFELPAADDGRGDRLPSREEDVSHRPAGVR
jgi:hypothetical protein